MSAVRVGLGRTATCLVALACSLAISPRAEVRAGEVLFTVELTGSASHLARVSTQTGSIVQTFAPQPGIVIDGMAYDASSDILYGVDGGDALYSLDRTSGAFTQIGAASPVNIAGLAVHPTTFDLFGISVIGGALWSIDKGTGVASFIGPTIGDLGFGHGLTFAPDGTLFATDTAAVGTTALYTVDPQSGHASFVADIDRDLVVGISFDTAGVLYGSDNATNTLITIDPLTGLSSTVGPYGGFKHNAIAFVPEPSTLVLLGLGVWAVLRGRFHRLSHPSRR